MRVNSFLYPILVLAMVALLISSTDEKPIQVLQNKQGWIPVYIRYGNEPLENINLSLAEAFHEGSNNVNAVLSIQNHEDSSIHEDKIHDNASQNSPFVSAN